MSIAAAAPDVLSDRVRRRGLNGVLVYTFFMVAGFSMLMPLVAVHFVSNVGLAAALVGLALAVRQLTQQGLAIVGGVLSDRFGARRMICLGVLLRAAGFAGLAYADAPPMLFVAMITAALGGALFEAPYHATITALTTDANRSRYYTLNNWVCGVATTLGPLLGVLLLRFDFRLVCLMAAACFVLNFLIALWSLPRVPMPERPPPMRQGLGLVARDRTFLVLTALLMGYWFTALQINISFPLLAERLTGRQDSVGLMYALSAGLTVILQYPLVRWLERRWSTSQILVLGVTVMSLSVAAIGWAHGFLSFLLCVAAFSIGTLMALPTQQTLLANLADPRALGTFLGVSSLSLAVGGGLGNVVGGWLMDPAHAPAWPALPWVLYGAVGLACAAGLHWLTRSRPAPAQTAVAANL